MSGSRNLTKITLISLSSILLIFNMGCSDFLAAQDQELSPNNEELIVPESPPPSANSDLPDVSNLNLKAAADYSQQAMGTAVLVMKSGQVVFEDYHNGADPSTATHIHSATKGFWGFVVAKFIEEGHLTGFDQKISDILTEWQGTNKEDITLKHVMQLTSGLANDIDNLQGLDPAAPDLYLHTINNVPLQRNPGTAFSYGPVNYYVVGAIIQRIIEQKNLAYSDPLDYLQKEFFDIIDLKYSDWARDVSGNPHIPNGAFITPRQWVKWGQLVLQGGVWQGQQLIEPQYYKQLIQGGGVNPGHGLFFWLNNQGGYSFLPRDAAPSGSTGGFIYFDGVTDIIGILGAGKNRMYVIPSQDLVVIRQSLQEDDSYEDHEFLKALFEGP